VADDQPNIRLPLEYLLKSIPGVTVVSASDGAKALELAVKHKPSLVLLDVMMPKMDGYTACRQIKQSWGDHPAEIWFITARGSNFDLEAAQKAGATHSIGKPFDPDHVLKQVRQYLASLAVTAS
jgi:CheY-like chemotaxis protein